MKKSTKAMSKISHEYIDELKGVGVKMVIKKRSLRVVLIAATLTVFAVCVSLFVLIGSNPSLPEISQWFDKESSIAESFAENISTLSETSIGISENDSSPPNESHISTENSSAPDNSTAYNESSVPDDTSTSQPPNYNENGASFSAQQMADVLSIRKNDSTNAYRTLYFNSSDDIMLGEIPDCDLPILMGEDWNFEYVKASTGGELEDTLFLNGKTIQLPVDATYEEVYDAANEFLPTVVEYFNLDYSDMVVIKNESSQSYTMVIYDARKEQYFKDGHPISYNGPYVSLSIRCSVYPTRYISINTIVYKKDESKLCESERYDTITLSEAEALLHRGYVFGGHVCPICMANQPEVDFTEYDRVGIEYVQAIDADGSASKEHYPFYAFYKDLGNGRYARTYVPAFRVSGLEEYFKSQEEKHENINYAE